MNQTFYKERGNDIKNQDISIMQNIFSNSKERNNGDIFN